MLTCGHVKFNNSNQNMETKETNTCTVDTICAVLGTTQAGLSRLIGKRRAVVSIWKKRGVPLRIRERIAAAVKEVLTTAYETKGE